MPDGGNVDPKVLEDITREVRGFGEDFKAARASMEQDLATLRTTVEETKGSIGPEVQSKIDAFSTSIIAKHEKLENLVNNRMTGFEAKLNRVGMGGSGHDGDDESRSMVRDWYRMTLASRGELKVTTPLSDDDIPFKEIGDYASAFGLYLRRDEKAIETKAMEAGSDPDGGYWVQPEMSRRIITKVWESSPIRQIASVVTVGTDTLEIPNDFGEFGAGWVGEREDRAETTTSQGGVQRITVHEMYAQPKATQRLLDDASVNVESYIAGKVSDKFGRMEATAFVSGTGIKQPRGFLTYDAGTTLPGTIEQVVSGAATAVTSDGFINIMVKLKEPYQAGARWVMRRATLANIMTLKDLNDQYIWRPGLEMGHPSTILGYPITFAADMPAVGADALAVAFGNFAEAYQIVDRAGISTLRDPFTAKPFVMFYTRRRVGGDVVNFEAIKIMKISAS